MTGDMSKNLSAAPSADGNRTWWVWPWKYRESAAFVLGLLVVGLCLQLAGPLDIHLLRAPVSWGLGIGLSAMSIILGCLRGRLAEWLTGVPLSVCLIAAMLLLSLLMGLTPQLAAPNPDPGWPDRLGLTRMTASWPFILIYLATIIVLGAVTVRRIRRRPNLVFILNHLGLWVLLTAAGLGAADRQRYTMWVEEEGVEWRGRLANGFVVELPLAINLHDFDLEIYPPKITVISRQTGKPQPEGKAEWFQLDPERPQGRLGEWSVTLDKYIHLAIRGKDGVYEESPRPEANPAAHMIVRGPDGMLVSGWITDGGPAQPFQALNLTDDLALVMARPEPKRFTSDITFLTPDGQARRVVLEVNKPLTAGDWMVYQYSYDQEAGRMSRNSGFELVYDPWLKFIWASLLLMGAGAVVMIWQGRRRPSSSSDGKEREAA
ncbi:hypothetical protein C4J81_18360 [Deltaproteobacteria bacterium Smac51]|nr:hypothetical protein C4J81_18360 [Deltaproteobacteria bacterium Smac51]